jgi:hypothetical protein
VKKLLSCDLTEHDRSLHVVAITMRGPFADSDHARNHINVDATMNKKTGEMISGYQRAIESGWRQITDAKAHLRKQTAEVTNEQVASVNKLIDAYNAQVDGYGDLLARFPQFDGQWTPHYPRTCPASEGDFVPESGGVAGTWVDNENHWSYEFHPIGLLIKMNPFGEVVDSGAAAYNWRQENRAVYAGESASALVLFMTIKEDGSSAFRKNTQYNKKP